MANMPRGKGESSTTSIFDRMLTGEDGKPVNVAVEVIDKRPDTMIQHNLHHVADVEATDFFAPLVLLLIIFVIQWIDFAMMGLVVILFLQIVLVHDLWKRIHRRPSGRRAVGMVPPYKPGDWWLSIGIYLLALPVAFAARWVNIKVFLWLFPNSILREIYLGRDASLFSILLAVGLLVILLTLFTTVVLAPLTEELWFRGIGLAGFMKSGNRLHAVLWTSLIFGALHGPTRFLFTAVLGAAFAWIRLRTGSLYCSMAMHALHNLGVVVLGIVAMFSAYNQEFPGARPAAYGDTAIEEDEDESGDRPRFPDHSDELNLVSSKTPRRIIAEFLDGSGALHRCGGRGRIGFAGLEHGGIARK